MIGKIIAFVIGTVAGIPILSFIWNEIQKHGASLIQSVTSQAFQQNATNFVTSHVASYIAQAVK